MGLDRVFSRVSTEVVQVGLKSKLSWLPWKLSWLLVRLLSLRVISACFIYRLLFLNQLIQPSF